MNGLPVIKNQEMVLRMVWIKEEVRRASLLELVELPWEAIQDGDRPSFGTIRLPSGDKQGPLCAVSAKVSSPGVYSITTPSTTFNDTQRHHITLPLSDPDGTHCECILPTAPT